MMLNELHPANLKLNLKSDRFGSIVVLYESVDSTNTECEKLAAIGFPEGTVVTAIEQVEGRGRKQRQWFSSIKGSLVFSVILKPGKLPTGLTSLMAYSIIEVLDDYSPEIMIKWPNDIYYKKKKIGGILAEGKNEYVVIGAGLNINQQREDFPDEIAPLASSLRGAAGKLLDRGIILCRILESFEKNYSRWKFSAFGVFKEAVEERLLYINTDVIVEDAGFHKAGRFLGITEEGYILLLCGDDINVLTSGDLSLKRSIE
ncbi:MAG: biotin--[acetyl-CoA-carboxylase] ligase [Candidatus Krumholzibacteriota bacterium]|nr:biotin--[acetyl-CoA-carboxylase] ligase [Candidatus Krumholzibacteriota bacterium]